MELNPKHESRIIVIDNYKGINIKTNSIFFTKLGYSEKEYLSIKTDHLVYKESLKRYRELLDLTLSRGSSSDFIKLKHNKYKPQDVFINFSLVELGDYKWIHCIFVETKEIQNLEKTQYDANKFLDSIIENIPNMIFLKDAKELRFVRFNKAGEELLGYTREDLLGKNDYDFFPKEQADFFTEKDRAALKAKDPIDIPEEEIHTKHRGKRTLHTKKISVLDENGNPQYLLGISEDITERKKAEDLLDKAREQLEEAVEERTSDLTNVNQKLQTEIEIRTKTENTLKKNFDQISKKNRYQEIISEVTQSVHESIDLQTVLDNSILALIKNIDKVDFAAIYLVEGEEIVLKAHKGFTKDYIKRATRIPYPKGITWKTVIEGKSIYVPDVEYDNSVGQAGKDMGFQCCLIVPLFEDQKAVGTLAIVSYEKNVFDHEEVRLLEIVSKQISIAIKNAKQAEALRNSEERYRILFEQSPVGVYMFDKELTVTNCNQHLVDMFNSSYDKIIGKNIRELNNKTFLESMEKTLEGQDLYQEGIYEATHSSAKLWLSLHFSPILDSKGDVVGGIGVAEDITERKKSDSLLLTEKQILELISQEKDLKKILEHICMAAEEQSDEMLCSFLLVDDKGESLLTYAAPNLPEDYKKETAIVPIGPNIGSCGTAAFTKKQVIVADIQKDRKWKDFKDLASKNNLGACWSTPIISDESKLLGTFAMYYPAPCSPNSDELDIIERATHLARIAIERKDAKAALKENIEKLSKKSKYDEIISSVTSSVHSSLDLNDVLDNAVKSMHSNIDHADNVGVFFVEGDFAVNKANKGYPKELLEKTSSIPKPKGFTWKTIIEGKLLYCGDAETDSLIGPAGKKVGTKSYVGMPIKTDNKTIACISINSFVKNAFDQEEIKLLEIVAQQIAVAINNATQAEALKKSEETLRDNLNRLSKKTRYEEIVNAVSRSIHQSLELDEVFNNAVKVISKELEEAKNVVIYMVEGEIGDEDNPPQAVMKAIHGHTKDYIRRVSTIPYPKGATWKTILEAKKRYVPDTSKDKSIGKAGLDSGTKSYLSTPLNHNNKTVGCVHIHSTKINAFSEEELKLLEMVTRQLETAITNANKAEDLKKSEERLKYNLDQLSKKNRYDEIISTITRSVHSTIDLKEVLEYAAVALKSNVADVDNVAIYMIEGDEAVLKSQIGYPKSFTDRVSRIPKPKGLTWKTLIDGLPRFVPDVSEDNAIGPAGRKVGTKSYASMPIKQNNKTIGSINISSRKLQAFYKDEVKLLEIVATQIETAINNANQAEALKISREELRESREHFRLLVETTNVIPWEFDPATSRFTYVGPQVEKLMGYSAKQWYEKDFWPNHIHEEDRKYAADTCSTATDALQDHELEYRMIAKDGRTVWIYEMVSVISENGKPKTLRGFMIDVTERKISESEKREAQERYRALIEHSYDIIIETNINGTFLYINPTFNEILGYKDEELLGRSIFEHIHEDDAPEAITQFSKTIKDFKKGTATYRFRQKSGNWSWLESIASPFLTASGERRTVISSRDITERMESEKKLQDAFLEIETLKDQLEKENVYLKKEIELTYSHTDIIGQSKSIKSALNKIEQVAATDATVLLAGETGTGKELFANRIHNLSNRKDRAMVKVNCAALPSHLIESELFGHEKGAFTGAVSKNTGRFEVADGSTIFLDEVAELPLELQSKLLRVLQEGEFQRVGSSKTIKVDVRVITASNNELFEAVNQEKFREDLFYRLNVFPVNIPPLRERKEDIPDLLWFFISDFEKKMDKTIKNISRKDMENLINYPWPGNVRQLRNVIERSMIISSGPDLKIELPGINNEKSSSEIKEMHIVERDHISYILNVTNWRIRGKSGAAELLGLKPTTLESRIKKLGIKRSH